MTHRQPADSAPYRYDDFDPYRINVDLHCHSNISDGTLTPEGVVERAWAQGVEWLALTDHDEVRGLDRADAHARKLGIGFIPGVEVSVTWAGVTVHIVGLGVDRHNEVLIAGLHRTRNGRAERAREMADGLAKVGIDGAYEGAMKYVGNPDLISRSHFARFLVETGRCEDVHEVFERFLVEGKPGFVPHRWARLRDAVAWIRGAGGTAVIAHPARYRLTDLEATTFLDEFIEAGGEGIEVVTSAHTAEEMRRYTKIAKEYGLKASRGSDFHSPEESRVDLGALPAMPDALEPIWAQWGIG